MSGIDVHHNVVRFLWRLVRADGSCGDISIDFGEVGPDGRLAGSSASARLAAVIGRTGARVFAVAHLPPLMS